MVLAYRYRWFFRSWYALMFIWNVSDFIRRRTWDNKFAALSVAFAIVVWLLLELRYLRRACGILCVTGRPGFSISRGALFTAIGEPQYRSLHKAWANSEGKAEVLIEEVHDG
jgi:hypothetical protein